MTPLIKSLLEIGLAVGGHYLFRASEPKTLEEKFRKERITFLSYEVIDSSTDDGWDKKLTEYKDNNITDKFTKKHLSYLKQRKLNF